MEDLLFDLYNQRQKNLTNTGIRGIPLYDDMAPIINTSYGVANEPDVEEEIEETSNEGLSGLLRTMLGFAIPGAGLFMGDRSALEGIKSLNQRLQQSDFGQATSLMDYLDMRKYGGLQGRNDAAARNMAQAKGITKSLASKPSSTSGGYQQGPGGSGAQTTSAKSKTSSPTNVGNPFGYR